MFGDPVGLFDLFLCPSSFMEEALHRVGIKNTVRFPNPAMLDGPPSSPRLCCRDRLVLAFVGRVAPEKGLRQLIELARATHFSRLDKICVYGDGPDSEKIKSEYPELIRSNQVVFHGTFARNDLFEALRRQVDAVIVPSVGAENAPLVVAEAAHLGLPVIVNDVGSLTSFGDDIGNKIRYTSSPEGLIDALDRTIAHLADGDRKYDASAFSFASYQERLKSVMQIQTGNEQRY
jgi:glycosyltransferase involved in cell wall biosynthesis